MRRTAAIAIVASILTIIMWSGAATAFESGIYEQGLLVPYATYDTMGKNTVVGLVLGYNPGVSAIYWSYMSINGVQLSSGSIPVSADFFTFPFSLSAADGGVNAGTQGWLIFTWDNNGTLEPGENTAILTGNAFLLDLSANDAAFIPSIPVDRNDYQAGPVSLNNLPTDVLVSMEWGVWPASNDLLSVRFTNDPSILGVSVLFIFTPLDAPAQFTAFADSDSGVSSPDFTMNSTGTRLNMFDLSAITQLDAVTNGIINVDNPAASPIGFAFVLSSSSVLGAAQTTIVNAYY